LEWRKTPIAVVAHSEMEARWWWNGLADHERDELLGLGAEPEGDCLF
jgi:hypothetical protein